MLLHIVRSGETIRGIADNYQCEISDITSNNLHITDFKNLKAGMKLRIPFLSKPIMDTLEETESFIQDYYPDLKGEFKKEKFEEVRPNVEPEPVIEVKKEEEISKPLTLPKNPELPRYDNYPKTTYSGNVIPKIPKEYIKKI